MVSEVTEADRERDQRLAAEAHERAEALAAKRAAAWEASAAERANRAEIARAEREGRRAGRLSLFRPASSLIRSAGDV